MPGTRTKMMSAYARLLGLRNSIPSNPTVPIVLAMDLNEIIDNIRAEISEVADSFYLMHHHIGRNSGANQSSYMNTYVLLSKINQFISYLEHVHHMNSTIIEIGSLFNSIKDQDLKARCSDLLSAPGNFDRAINQATQVLEDKIRQKSGIDGKITGPNLVNAAINSNLDRGILKVSDNI